MTELNRTKTVSEMTGIREVILEQLRDLSNLDGERALQRLTRARRKGSGNHFLKSITHVFPQLAQVWKAEFGELKILDGRYAQQVRVTAHDRSTLVAIYLVERQGDGTFLIDGCVCGSPPEQPLLN